MRRSILINFTLLVCTLIVFFGGIEIALRVTGIDHGVPRTPPIYEKSADPHLSYEMKPNLDAQAFRSTIVTDRRGFRSPELRPGKSTIVMLGDSIAFGYGLQNDETMGAHIDAALNGAYNVAVAAAPGYDLEQEAGLYADKVADLHPGTLILEFHWNDLTSDPPNILDDDGNLHAYNWTPSTPECDPIETGFLGWLPGRCWLDLHSAFYRTVKKIISARTEQQNAAAQIPTLTQNAFGDYVTDAQLTAYEQQFAAFAKTLPKSMNKLYIIWTERPLHLVSEPKLQAFVEQQGFQVLNMYDIFGNRAETLSWDTVHPSAETSKEAAAVIVGALKEWKLLPPVVPDFGDDSSGS